MNNGMNRVMDVEVQFTTQLRTALDRSEQQLSVQTGTTVSELLRQLATIHSDAFSRFVLDADGKLLPNMILCVGDQQVTQPETHVLSDGDTVTLLSAISGG